MVRCTTLLILSFFGCVVPVSLVAETRVLAHRFGETEISGTPERVVSLSFIGHDFLLGLDTVPIALRYWYGDGPFGIWPWATHKLDDAEPIVIYGGIDVEEIALLKPDLILAQWSGITEVEYQLLSRVAPTVPPPVGATDYSASWQQMLSQIGLALNKMDAAQAQIIQIEAQFERVRTVYPEWKVNTEVTVWPNQIGADTRSELRCKFMEELGFVNAPEVEALAINNTYNVRISRENLDPIDTDVLIWLTVSDPIAALDNIALRKTMRAYREGREVIADPVLTAAMSHSVRLRSPTFCRVSNP